MNLTDICCGLTFPIIIASATIIWLYLHKKKVFLRLKLFSKL